MERNHQAGNLYLSENPWRCECIFMLRFQEFLQKHRQIVSDSTNVTCSYPDNDERGKKLVLSLKRGDVCKLPSQYLIHPLDMLNIILAILIILIVTKLIYDYYHYRKSGKLPWIVAKMP